MSKEEILTGIICHESNENLCDQCPYKNFYKCEVKLEEDAYKLLKEYLQADNIQEALPHWNKFKDNSEILIPMYTCSECNQLVGWKSKYCPNCGIKMINGIKNEFVTNPELNKCCCCGDMNE